MKSGGRSAFCPVWRIGRAEQRVLVPTPARPASKRWALGLLGSICAVSLGILLFPDFGALLADAARDVVGPRPVAFAEDVFFGVVDGVKRRVTPSSYRRRYWAAASAAPSAAPATATPSRDTPPSVRVLAPEVALPDDGNWQVLGVDPSGRASMFRTEVHPDAQRPYATVAIVALDLERVALRLVAGTEEPRQRNSRRRPGAGVVPPEDRDRVAAIFTGGFKGEHGGWGMRIRGRNVLGPLPNGCLLFVGSDERVTIGPWPLAEAVADPRGSFRQTPPCLIEGGRRARGLEREASARWGDNVDGATIIRRSAVGLGVDARWLYYAIGDDLSAYTIALALEAAGARDAAMLEVNRPHPRFWSYSRRPDGERAVSSLIGGVTSRSSFFRFGWKRDFVYVVFREPSARPN